MMGALVQFCLTTFFTIESFLLLHQPVIFDLHFDTLGALPQSTCIITGAFRK